MPSNYKSLFHKVGAKLLYYALHVYEHIKHFKYGLWLLKPRSDKFIIKLIYVASNNCGSSLTMLLNIIYHQEQAEVLDFLFYRGGGM